MTESVSLIMDEFPFFLCLNNDHSSNSVNDNVLEIINHFQVKSGCNNFEIHLSSEKPYSKNLEVNNVIDLIYCELINKYGALCIPRAQIRHLIADKIRKNSKSFILASKDNSFLKHFTGTHLCFGDTIKWITVKSSSISDHFYQEFLLGRPSSGIPNLLPRIGPVRIQQMVTCSELSLRELASYVCEKLDINYEERFRLLYYGDSSLMRCEKLNIAYNKYANAFIYFTKNINSKLYGLLEPLSLDPKSMVEDSVFILNGEEIKSEITKRREYAIEEMKTFSVFKYVEYEVLSMTNYVVNLVVNFKGLSNVYYLSLTTQKIRKQGSKKWTGRIVELMTIDFGEKPISIEKKNAAPKKPKGGDHVIEFGAHKGKTIREIYEINKNYYNWMKQNVEKLKNNIKIFEKNIVDQNQI